MPLSTKQTQGEIIHALRKEAHWTEGQITETILNGIMADAGVESPATVRNYKNALIALNMLKRIPGGYALTQKARRDSIITIRVPEHNKGAVIKGLTAALQQFKPLATMEIEG